ncbi:MAG: phosphopantetheine-binding protein [Mesorhizobium sp.]
MTASAATIDEVKQLIVQTLGIDDPSRISGASTQLFGNLPELDSFAVVNLAMEIESRFGFEIDEDGFSAEVFETVGSLADYIDQNRRH